MLNLLRGLGQTQPIARSYDLEFKENPGNSPNNHSSTVHALPCAPSFYPHRFGRIWGRKTASGGISAAARLPDSDGEVGSVPALAAPAPIMVGPDEQWAHPVIRVEPVAAIMGPPIVMPPARYAVCLFGDGDILCRGADAVGIKRHGVAEARSKAGRDE